MDEPTPNTVIATIFKYPITNEMFIAISNEGFIILGTDSTPSRAVALGLFAGDLEHLHIALNHVVHNISPSSVAN